MKVKVRKKGGRNVTPVYIESEFIRLDALLKFACVAQSGGQAKLLIQEGRAAINGVISTQRGKKIYPGDMVLIQDNVLKIIGAHKDIQK
ncbi:MAG: RNA-binding S4 domain-containing protein [Clostridiales bacterium]|jgi:ribosome-associated protein|nr:RNA-binding S4 domain-containing protein [Clostridiales bacterium]